MFYFLIGVLLLSACSEQPPGLSPLEPGATVLAFGNSLTFGTGARSKQSYPARLAQLTSLNIINAGNPGEVTRDGLKRLPGLLEKYRPALLILCHGGNDMLRKQSPAQMRDNLEAMIQLTKEKGIEVVLIGVPKPGLFLSSAEVYLDIAKKYDIPIEPDILAEVLGENELKADPVHPNAKGYTLISEAIYQLLQENGAI